jgi:hypothetical protein
MFSFDDVSFSLINAPGDKPFFGEDIGALDRMPAARSWLRSSDRRTLRRRVRGVAANPKKHRIFNEVK